MLRGVPVIASHVGGIPEAKLGVDYLLPVRPIERYGSQVDEQMVPLADVPAQDVGPWQAALGRLLLDRTHYDGLSRTSREAALGEAASLSAGPFEALLERLPARPSLAASVGLAIPAVSGAVERLSADRRKLLALRLRRVSAGARLAKGALRLFCFPHAGGGTTAFRDWAGRLPPAILVVPMRPPRTRPRGMAELVAALGEAIDAYLDEPFAFFGHSMGAIVAFELARLIRRQNRPLPRILVASGARAPQFRRGHVPPPEPGAAEFVDALRRLEGTPPEVLDNPTLMQVILPALRDDAAIYRNYVYAEDPPLDCPVHAYGGAKDPNIHREHLEGWKEQTTASFALRVFPGGHFYLQTYRQEFLAALARDLRVGEN
jgi:medium-chain acyl-[acyl-carrier-protein] hydrolase